jgi:hypothetical protein
LLLPRLEPERQEKAALDEFEIIRELSGLDDMSDAGYDRLLRAIPDFQNDVKHLARLSYHLLARKARVYGRRRGLFL